MAKYAALVKSGRTIVIPEVADYEVRRALILAGLSKSVQRLDQLNNLLDYMPLTTAHMRHATQLWANCRMAHRPNSDPKRLDGDVIIATQALAIDGEIVTENADDFSLLVDAIRWQDL